MERFQVAEAIARAEVVECLRNSNGNGNAKREKRHKGCAVGAPRHAHLCVHLYVLDGLGTATPPTTIALGKHLTRLVGAFQSAAGRETVLFA